MEDNRKTPNVEEMLQLIRKDPEIRTRLWRELLSSSTAEEVIAETSRRCPPGSSAVLLEGRCPPGSSATEVLSGRCPPGQTSTVLSGRCPPTETISEVVSGRCPPGSVAVMLAGRCPPTSGPWLLTDYLNAEPEIIDAARINESDAPSE